MDFRSANPIFRFKNELQLRNGSAQYISFNDRLNVREKIDQSLKLIATEVRPKISR